MTFWILLSVAIIALSFAMKPIRFWLERCADQAERQGKLVEEYYRSATRFLSLTSEKDHAEARNMVTGVGSAMMKGTLLISMLILSRRRAKLESRKLNGNDIWAAGANADDPLEGLSDEAKHAFSHALGASLLVSSYQSLFYGSQYRSVLLLLLEDDQREVKEPQQLVYRYQKARRLPPHNIRRTA